MFHLFEFFVSLLEYNKQKNIFVQLFTIINEFVMFIKFRTHRNSSGGHSAAPKNISQAHNDSQP